LDFVFFPFFEATAFVVFEVVEVFVTTAEPVAEVPEPTSATVPPVPFEIATRVPEAVFNGVEGIVPLMGVASATPGWAAVVAFTEAPTLVDLLAVPEEADVVTAPPGTVTALPVTIEPFPSPL